MRPKCTSSTSHPFDATELTLADIRPTQRHVIDKHVSFLPHPLLHLHPPSSMAPPPRRNPPHQNPTRRKVRARTAQRAPSPPSVALRNPHSLLSLSLSRPLLVAGRGAVARREPPPGELPPGPRHRVPPRPPPRLVLVVEAQVQPGAGSGRRTRAGLQLQAGVGDLVCLGRRGA